MRAKKLVLSGDPDIKFIADAVQKTLDLPFEPPPLKPSASDAASQVQ